MISMNHVLRLGESIARVFPPFVLILGCASTALAESVTLKDGKTYEVETVRGRPVRFVSDQIKVIGLGIGTQAPVRADKSDGLHYVWILVAELAEKRRFAVTVTTPLDPAASASFEVDGPGEITPDFFSQPDYSPVWEGIDRPGVRWFPFHFVFEDKESRKRFEFTQWSRIDDRMWNAVRAQRERDELTLKKQATPASEVPERWNFGFDARQWRLGYQSPTRQGAIREYVLPGQTVRDWSGLVTSQYVVDKTSSRDFFEQFRGAISRDCPSLRLSMIEESTDTIIFEWQHAGCQGHLAQHEILRISRGATGLHMLSYTEKTQQMPDDRRTAWISILKAASVRPDA